MTLQSGLALLGALLVAGGLCTAAFALGADWTVLGIVFAVAGGLGIVSYIVAAATAGTGFGEFMRGWLIGLNTALNAIFAWAILTPLAGKEAGIIAGCALGALNLMCTLAPVSQNGFFQGLIGYLNWILPMSWPIVALGLAFTMLSLVLFILTLGRVSFLQITGAGMDWKTGTLFFKGGLIANLNYLHTAFNMGNFSFVDNQSTSGWHMEHEAGHTLNLAAFGWLFHLIGAVDENVIGRGHSAYAERIADSNSSAGGGNIPMWA